jgi:hypothetical protein
LDDLLLGYAYFPAASVSALCGKSRRATARLSSHKAACIAAAMIGEPVAHRVIYCCVMCIFRKYRQTPLITASRST